MAFLLHSTDDGRVPAWEYLPATGLLPKVGMALKLSGGKLVAATGTTQPQFICMRSGSTVLTANDAPIPVIRVTSDMIFEVLSAVELDPGDTFTLSSDSMRVTVGEGSGVVEEVLPDNYVRVRI